MRLLKDMNHDDIIFGKNTEQRIVALEPKDNFTEIFIQNSDGTIISKFIKNEYFVLCHNQISDKWTRLKGDNYYQWARKFDDRDIFLACRSALKYQEIFSIYDAKESFMIKTGHTYFKGMKHTELDVLSFDTETTGLVKDETSKVILISNTFRSSKGLVEKKLFSYDQFKNDGEMIETWCAWVREKNPSILLGHNICGYDLPYLAHVADMYGKGKDLILGRDDSKLWFNNYESKFRKDQTQFIKYFKPNCYGRNIIDTMFLAIKSDIGKRYDSYGLKSIIKTEGLEKQNRVFYDASQIRNNYLNPIEMDKIKQYAKDDSDDALALFDLYCPPFFYSTQSIPKSFQQVTETASGSQINAIMLRSYIQYGYSIPKADEVNNFQGALSAGIPGIYSNCFKVDAVSLYPSIIRQYEICDMNKDPFKHFLMMTEYFTIERIKNKELFKQTGDKYFDHLQNTQKIFANSLFGFLSAAGLNFNSPQQAALITKKGREILEIAVQWATGRTYDQWNL